MGTEVQFPSSIFVSGYGGGFVRAAGRGDVLSSPLLGAGWSHAAHMAGTGGTGTFTTFFLLRLEGSRSVNALGNYDDGPFYLITF